MRTSLSLVILTLASFFASCASTQSVGYSDGWVTSSTVSYRFTGPPLLEAGSAQTYNVAVEGTSTNPQVDVATFEKSGMRHIADAEQANVAVTIVVGKVGQGEAGAMKLGDRWYPTFEIKVPFQVQMRHWSGSSLGGRSGVFSDYLTFKQLQSFPTREKAIGAIETVRKLAKSAVQERGRAGAVVRAQKDANALAKSLFQERDIAMDVPVVRSAAGLELEEAYELLAAAEKPADVRAALRLYERAGMSHTNDDGSANNTANYGIACGMAACHLMLRDLSAAWEYASRAKDFEPTGREVDQIRNIVYQQEITTGERVIPEDERAEIDKAVNTAEKWGKLLGKFAE